MVEHSPKIFASKEKATTKYFTFLNFEKVFDSLKKFIVASPIKNRIKGKPYRCIKTTYDDMKVRVRCVAKFSNFTSCTRGVKQGGIYRPVLFPLFINELALETINNGRHRASRNPDFIELFMMLFADGKHS